MHNINVMLALPVALQLALLAAGGETVSMDWKIQRPAGSGIRLNATGVPWKSYPGDRGIAVPTTFSWRDGYPTATASRVQCGLFTDGKGSADGFTSLVELAPEAREVRAYVGSYGTSGLLSISLLDRTGAPLALDSHTVPAEDDKGPARGVGSAELVVRWSGQPLPAYVRVRWSPLAGGGNLQFNAVAVATGGKAGLGARASPPCGKPLCTTVQTCAGNCVDVDLGASGVLDWLHTGPASGSSPPLAPPTYPSCGVKHSDLPPLGHLQIGGPATANVTDSWRAKLRAWREGCLAELKLSAAIYDVPQLAWGKTAYFQPLMMPFDRYFYNATLGNYTVARYLDSLTEQYSGIDSVLLWPTYTNIGAPLRL